MAITERYVRADAAGGGDGTTNTNSGPNGAFTFSEAISDINSTRVGYRYNIKAGTYTRSATDTLLAGAAGTTTSPNIFRGFNETPGDLDDLPRNSNGWLNTTNYPAIVYNTNFRFAGVSAARVHYQNLKFTGNYNGILVRVGTGGQVYNCYIENSSSGSSASCLDGTNAADGFVNNDLILTSTGSTSQILYVVGYAIGNRIKGNMGACVGINVVNNAGRPIALNTVENVGIGIHCTTTNSQACIFNNTITNTYGDAIYVVALTTAQRLIIGNHITDCGGYAINFQLSTCEKILYRNRFRDNSTLNAGAGVNIWGGGDYETATSLGVITSDDTQEMDYYNYGSGDYRLKTTAAGYGKFGSFGINIGSMGTPNISSGSILMHPGMMGGVSG